MGLLLPPPAHRPRSRSRLLGVSFAIFALPVLLGLVLGILLPAPAHRRPRLAGRRVARPVVLWVAPEVLCGPYLAAQALPVFALAMLAIVMVAVAVLPRPAPLRGGLRVVPRRRPRPRPAPAGPLGDRPRRGAVRPAAERRRAGPALRGPPGREPRRAGLPRARPARRGPRPRGGARLRPPARRDGERAVRADAGRPRRRGRPPACPGHDALLFDALATGPPLPDGHAAAPRVLPEGRRPRRARPTA